MANENKLQEIIAASLENIRSMVDANTVIGNPINTPQGTTIIPVSKISLGFASGGLDYASKTEEAVRARLQNFGGGGAVEGGMMLVILQELVVGDHFPELFLGQEIVADTVLFTGTGRTGGCGDGEDQILTGLHDLLQNGTLSNAGSAGNYEQFASAQVSSSSNSSACLSIHRA